ncbi:MAG: 50S ribosomal protein L11 methyltransferase, partial [Gemmatimonadetes bacterium]|nr:50S ribosomal protein L11 methyltransferase [Gemmatimonadota bacterium]
MLAWIAADIGSPGVELLESAPGIPGVLQGRARLYFPEGDPAAAEARVRRLWSAYGGGAGRGNARGRPGAASSRREPVFTPFAEPARDWGADGRCGFTGTTAGPFWIGPPWIDPPAGAIAIRINPGRAFGTGLHPTT